MSRSRARELFTIRPYKIDEEEQLVDFLEISFNGWPAFDLDCSPVEHWKWKFLENPLRLNSIVVAETDDKIIGFSSTIYQHVKVGNRILFAGRGADLAVHPEYRRRGISKKMSDLKKEMHREKDVQMRYGGSGNPIVIQQRKKKGILSFPHIICEKVCIIDFNKFLERYNVKYKFLKKIVFLGIKNINIIKNSIQSYRINVYNDHDIKIRKIDKFDENVNIFWESIKDDYYFIIERTQEYLDWRYCDKRGGNYCVYIAEQNSKILGYIVLRINRKLEKYPEGTVVDLLTLSNRLDVANKLIVHAIDYFDDNDALSVRVLTIKNHPYEVLYERHGFVEINRRARNFISTTPDDVGEEWSLFESAQPNQLHFQYGDLDWI